MSFCYSFYNPNNNFECVEEGNFVDMPFYDRKYPVKVPMAFRQTKAFGYDETFNDPYDCTGLLSRKNAIELQKYMEENSLENKTMFTDLMNKNNTDVLVFRIR